MDKKVELLAPAGSFESLHAAIQAGADAVYFGVEQLNMRARSANTFYVKDLREIAAVCHEAGIRAYITLNTVMYDHDMQLLRKILKEVKKQGITAVIASDFAVFEYCKSEGIPVHISTQANASNVETVRFFSGFADLVVLARELTLSQISQITREIARKKITGVSGDLMKIEVFVHGALCMAISGKCYLSLHDQNASANRGACIQNCRHKYEVTDLESGDTLLIDNEYIMSPKDLCLIDVLDQVLGSGVDVLKIEGRSKGPEYVYTVTKCYREALDALEDGSYGPEKISKWMEALGKVYNRGFWNGYYLGRKLGEWSKSPGSAATEKKVYIGKATKYYPRIQVGEFLIETGSIRAGDTLMISSPSFGIHKEKIEGLVVNGAPNDKASKGDKITLPLRNKVSGKEKLYKIVDAADA